MPDFQEKRYYRTRVDRFMPILARWSFIWLLVLVVVAPAAAEDRILWRYVTSGRTLGDPIVHDTGDVSVVGDDRNLYRLRPDGSRGFRTSIGGPARSLHSALPDGSVLVERENGTLLRITDSGYIDWALLPTLEAIVSIAASDRGAIIVAYEDGGLRALNYAGRPIWAVSVGAEIVHGPIIDVRGRIYIVTADDELLVLGPGGDVRASFQPTRAPQHLVSLHDGRLVSADSNGRIQEIDTTDGTQTMRVDAGEPIKQLLIDADETIIYLGHSGTLYAAAEGNESHAIAERVESVTGTGAGRYVVVRSDLTVTVIDRTGTEYVSIRLHEAGELSSPVAGRGGHVAISGSRWVTYGFFAGEGESPAWTGGHGSGLRDNRAGPVRGETRSDWLQIVDFRVLEGMVTAGGLSEREHVLSELENRAVRGELGRSYPYASYLVDQVVGDLRSDGVVRPAATRLVLRGYDLLGYIGDVPAGNALARNALSERDPVRAAGLMAAIANTGYDHTVSREEIISQLYRRVPKTAGLEQAVIQAFDTLWEQGVRPGPRGISILMELSISGRSDGIRVSAQRVLSQRVRGR